MVWTHASNKALAAGLITDHLCWFWFIEPVCKAFLRTHLADNNGRPMCLLLSHVARINEFMLSFAYA